MNPSDVGNSDRLVVQEVLKEIAQYHLADTNSKRQFKGKAMKSASPASFPRALGLNGSFVAVIITQSCCSWRWTA